MTAECSRVPPGLDPVRLAHAERVLQEWCGAGVLRGAVLALARREGPVRLRSWGVADTAGGVEPMRPDHRFLLTSITKTFTALQVLQAVEAGVVTLDTPVAEVVPAFAAGGKQDVRLWHALTHTTGLDDTEANTAEGPPRGLTPADHLAAACAAPLRAAPGTRVAYCSPPFWALAEIVRRCTGTSHVEHLAQWVAAPLGLRDTRYEPGPEVPERLVLPHVGAGHAHLGEQVRRSAYPAGGVVSSARDLVAYGRMLLRGGVADDGTVLLSRPAVAALWRPWTTGLPGARTYEGVERGVERGLGWALGGPGDLPSRRTLWHSGGSGTSLWVDPDHDLVVVLLTATWFLSYERLARVANAAAATVVA